MSRKIIKIGKNLFVDSQPIDEPECKRDIDDPSGAFVKFLTPRIKNGTDDASKEVRAAMQAGSSLSTAVLDTIESLPANKTFRLQSWVALANESRVYAFLRFLPRNQGVEYGLRLTEGGPRDKVIAEEEIDNYGPQMDLNGDPDVKWIKDVLFDVYGSTARDKAMLKSACVKLRRIIL